MGMQFQHATPAFRAYCGDHALDAIPIELDRLGVSRVVLFFGPSMERNVEALDRVKSALGARLAGHFNEVREHSPVSTVLAGVDALRDARADGVMAVGGGSAIVTARAAAILLAEKRDVRELCTQRRPDGTFFSPKLLEPKLPQWIVPTTPSTAYAKAGSALRDAESGERLALFDPKTRAQGVFFDPELAMTAPASLALSAGLNAFAMAVEGLLSGLDDPLAVALLTHALRELKRSLPTMMLEPANPESRLRSMVAALLAGQGSDYAGGGLAQVLSHAAGPFSSTSNGMVEAVLLPAAMRYNMSATGEGNGLVANALDESASLSDGGERSVREVENVLGELDVPSRLRDIDVARESMPAIVERALNDWALSRVPNLIGRDELRKLLDAAW